LSIQKLELLTKIVGIIGLALAGLILLLAIFSGTAAAQEAQDVQDAQESKQLREPTVHVRAGEGAWTEQEHNSTDYISISAAGAGIYEYAGGYNDIVNADTLAAYRAELYFSESVPLLSRLSWVSTPETDIVPELVDAEHNQSSYSKGFVELRMPFKVTMLSHEASLYLQYAYTAKSMGDLASDFLYNGDTFAMDNASIGSRTHYVALAMSTPVAKGDAQFSLSQFGMFYQFEERLRHAEMEAMTQYELIGINEHRIGFFYDITKPVFTEGFIMNVHLRLAFAFRTIHNNVHNYNVSSFHDASSLIMADIGTTLAYRFTLGEYVGIKLFADYEYNAAMPITSQNDFDNGYGQHASAGLMVDYSF
jgi:hypothetical protein